MQDYYYELADYLTSRLQGQEVMTSVFHGEDSDFVRLNQSKIRQAGRIKQLYLVADLVNGSRHVEGFLTLTGANQEDRRRCDSLLEDLRAKIASLPEDPHLMYNTDLKSTEQFGDNKLPPVDDAVAQILEAGQQRDVVGLYSSGGLFRGFANSLGQRNWYSNYSFNFDWSLYLRQDKAVKTSYAGFSWDRAGIMTKMERASEQLSVLENQPKVIKPGEYRVYLAPAALYDYLGILGWDGYGLKAHRTKQTPLIRMIEDGVKLHPSITVLENTRDGVAPNFQSKGFLRPDQVNLIQQGAFHSCLVSPRSSKEYGVPTNGANPGEGPESLDVAAGGLSQDSILDQLGTGLLINNLHYLNYSDRPACRVTGLTRFACFWVEGGKITAPIDVMRFDETIYRAMGENLVGLTSERELILDPETYDERSTSSGRVPGALVEGFRFNL
jgi:predicted Zn-dependent protease